MSLEELAEKWIEIDNTPAHQEEIKQKLAENDQAWLQENFGSRLSFGTAGLRGKMGAGTNGMNRGMVQQTSLGIALTIKAQFPDKKPAVVIGYDARHNSKIFAEDTARIFASQGFTVFLFHELCATPVLSYAVLSLKTNVGIMVTASHNPAADNGYKVYWSNGAQIISPQDSDISAQIQTIADNVVWKGLPSIEELDITPVSQNIINQYFKEISKLRIKPATGAKLVYSGMHGVGTRWVKQALEEAGHDFQLVKEQAEPDGDFPTVMFPNPEEKGALDLSIALAKKLQADAVLANDPDADRLAVSLPSAKGSWVNLTGDQVGLLLADYILEFGQFEKTPLVLTSLVSSSLLETLAQRKNIHYGETLTGFKWIANRGILLAKELDAELVFGFEESLGYCIGSVAMDKDGVSAVLLMADLISYCKSKGLTLWDRLASLYMRLGFALSKQKSITKPGSAGKAEIDRILEYLRSSPPSEIAGVKVWRVRDYLKQESREADGTITKLQLPKSNVLGFDLDNGDRVLARPSGTEPKIKFYLEAKKSLNSAEEYEQVQAKLLERLEELQEGILSQLG